MSRSIADFLFPRPSGKRDLQEELDQQRDSDLSKISASQWDREVGLALSEAERISALEADRRKSAEGKAATYLALVSALLTITLSFQTAVMGGKAGPAPAWLSLSFAIVAVVYLAAAATFLFAAIRTDTTYRVGAPDLVKFWSSGKDPRPGLIKEKLLASRYDQDMVNKKITYINVAQRHIYNAAMVVALLIPINALWYAGGLIAGGAPPGQGQNAPARARNSPGAGSPATIERGKTGERTKEHAGASQASQARPAARRRDDAAIR